MFLSCLIPSPTNNFHYIWFTDLFLKTQSCNISKSAYKCEIKYYQYRSKELIIYLFKCGNEQIECTLSILRWFVLQPDFVWKWFKTLNFVFDHFSVNNFSANFEFFWTTQTRYFVNLLTPLRKQAKSYYPISEKNCRSHW